MRKIKDVTRIIKYLLKIFIKYLLSKYRCKAQCEGLIFFYLNFLLVLEN